MKFKLYHFKSLESTQEKSKSFSKKGLKNIIVIADTQTNAYGRFKRKWYSSKEGLWMSFLLKPNNTQNLQYLTFAAAIAVVRAIRKNTKLNVKIKWPNDVHYKGKKICGILTEGIFGKENYVVVGIGLNVNQNEFSYELKYTANSLKLILGKKVNKTELINLIIKEFFELYSDYYEKNKHEFILNLWKNHCDTLDKEVTVITQTKKLNGKAIGVDKDCNLLLKLKNKRIIKIIEGDLNIRY